jgi:DNA replication initiation complex subunit (GINS family)
MRIPVVIKKDCEVDLGEGPFSLRAGEERELEHWQLRVLRRHGLAEPLHPMGPTAVRKLRLSEAKQPGLQPLPQGFYPLLAEEMEHLRREGGEEELRKVLEDLLELRLQKLVRLSLFPSQTKGATPEERRLLEELAGRVEEWKDWMNQRLEVGKDEGGRTLQELGGENPDLQKS